MMKRSDLNHWAIFILAALGTTWYLVSFAALVGNESTDGLLSSTYQKESTHKPPSIMHATFTTNLGSFTVELYKEQSPRTVENFVKLAQSGFYDGTRFHRVIKGFMIQGGDPLSKDTSQQARWGTGGPGYQFPDEINPNAEPYLTGYKRGVLAMANSGPNTNGSQFFVMHQDYPLPPNYTIFGKVTSGMDTVDKIATTPTAPGDRPLSDVVLEKVVVK